MTDSFSSSRGSGLWGRMFGSSSSKTASVESPSHGDASSPGVEVTHPQDGPIEAWASPDAEAPLLDATVATLELNAHEVARNSGVEPGLAALHGGVDGTAPGSSCTSALEPTMEHVLAATNGELQRCRLMLERLRSENRRVVPLVEVERWCTQVTSQLGIVMDAMAVKIEACHTKVRARDETIRRLHQQLQEYRKTGPVLNGRAAQAAVGAGNARTSSMLPTASDDELTTSMGPRSMASTAGDGADTDARSSRGQGSSPVGLAISRIGASSEEDRTLTATGSSRLKRSVDPALQKAMARRGSTDAYALERAQHAQLKREVAHLRRGHVELVGQVRDKNNEVEQLHAMLRELVAQRQMGFYKRQLHLQDPALYALQEGCEELLQDRAQQAEASGAEAATAAAVSSNGDGPRSARAARLSQGATLQASQERRPTRAGAGATGALGPRGGLEASDRGRASFSGSFGGPTAASSRRERSVSTAPYTPRGKLRDVVGHPTRVAVETPAAQRRTGRTTSTARVGAVGRSTSVEDRTGRRIRDGIATNRRR